mmetsp:Transcript_160413/g.510450  ORF Transcript_160413/g.510450 Transcript_160413/m.510450 type:complete len:245 (-) Transcript_160413:143-877(-)
MRHRPPELGAKAEAAAATRAGPRRRRRWSPCAAASEAHLLSCAPATARSPTDPQHWPRAAQAKPRRRQSCRDRSRDAEVTPAGRYSSQGSMFARLEEEGSQPEAGTADPMAVARRLPPRDCCDRLTWGSSDGGRQRSACPPCCRAVSTQHTSWATGPRGRQHHRLRWRWGRYRKGSTGRAWGPSGSYPRPRGCGPPVPARAGCLPTGCAYWARSACSVCAESSRAPRGGRGMSSGPCRTCIYRT